MSKNKVKGDEVSKKGSDSKKFACNAGDPVSITGSGRLKEMATHSSILAWRIPWTGEPRGLQSLGSQRVRKDWVTNTQRSTLGGEQQLCSKIIVGLECQVQRLNFDERKNCCC